jgi:hypothetical protein
MEREGRTCHIAATLLLKTARYPAVAFEGGVYILPSLLRTTTNNSIRGLGSIFQLGKAHAAATSSLKRLERCPRLDGAALFESDIGSSKIAIATAEERFNAGINCQRFRALPSPGVCS